MRVHAFVRAGQRVPDGVDGVGRVPARLRVLAEGRVGAVVSDAPARPRRPRPRHLAAHQGLLLALGEGGPVLPMRFGTVLPDEATVRRGLAAAEARHLATLERLSGRIEVAVAAHAPAQALASLVREDPAIRRLREEARRCPGYEARARLGEAVLTAMARRAAEAARHAVLELTPLARAVTPGPRVSGSVLTTSFLVDRATVDRFRDAVREFAVRRRDRVDLRVAGPLPCYSFVPPERVAAGPGDTAAT